MSPLKRLFSLFHFVPFYDVPSRPACYSCLFSVTLRFIEFHPIPRHLLPSCCLGQARG